MKTKKCSKCNIIKNISDFYISSRDNWVHSQCKSCEKKKYKEYYTSEAGKAARNKYYAENRSKCQEYQKKWQTKNLAYWREYNKLDSESLSDSYVKRRICNKFKIRSNSIPPDLIILYRDYLTAKRIIDNYFETN